MSRDLKVYFLVIGLPALALALGGLRLLGLEANRASRLANSALHARAEMIARELKGQLRAERPAEEELAERLPELLAALPPYDDEDEELAMVAEVRPAAAEKVRRHGERKAAKRKWGGAKKPRNAKPTADASGPERPVIQGHAQANLGPDARGWFVHVRWRDRAALVGQVRARVWMIGASVLTLLVMTLLAGGGLLVRSARQARREARLKTDFTANVSHEFKTPLTEIRLAAEFAQSRADGAEVKTALGDVIAATDRLTHMVADVLDFGRLSEGRRLAVEPVDVGGGVLALANPEALKHVLDNLLDNAAKYAPNAPVEKAVRVAGRRVYVDVMDRGPGVEESQREAIFERYRRDEKTAAGRPGCGLGLAIARLLARAMGGELTCSARAGGGATFTLELKKAEG